MKLKQIAVIIPGHNDRQNVLEFFKSTEKINDNGVQYFFIDDGSTDGTSRALQKQYPAVTILTGDGSLWWAGSVNLGVRRAIRAGYDYVYVINNDVILDEKIFIHLRKTAMKEPDSIITSKIYDASDPDRVWYFGAKFDEKVKDLILCAGPDTNFDKLTQVEVITGMGMFIPLSIFSKVGYFDEAKLPQYLADSDFGLRARKCGYASWVDPSAIIFSKTSSSWVNRQLENPRLRFVWDCFFARRSPYSLPIRFTFYRRHWPSNYIWALIVFYIKFTYRFIIRGVLAKWIKVRIKMLRSKAFL